MSLCNSAQVPPRVVNVPLGGVVPILPTQEEEDEEMPDSPNPDPRPIPQFPSLFLPLAQSSKNKTEHPPSTSTSPRATTSSGFSPNNSSVFSLPPPATTGLFTEPNPKKPRMEIFSTTWSWRIVSSEGKTLKSSKHSYLSKANCQGEMNSAKDDLEQEEEVEEGELSGVMMPEQVSAPSPGDLIRRIYKYLLQFELDERVHKFCTGCMKKAKNEKAHLEGCKSSEESKVQMHGQSAANRISSSRLYEACMSISAYYTKGQYVSTSDIQEVIASSKPLDILQQTSDEEFESEYCYLKLI